MSNHPHQPLANQPQRFAGLQEFGVVGDETTRGPQMNDRPGLGALMFVRVHVGHHIVPIFFFVKGGQIEIHILHTPGQLRDLFR